MEFFAIGEGKQFFAHDVVDLSGGTCYLGCVRGGDVLVEDRSWIRRQRVWVNQRVVHLSQDVRQLVFHLALKSSFGLTE